jgi:hypothetical protein
MDELDIGGRRLDPDASPRRFESLTLSTSGARFGRMTVS